jgi:hypothetical protein
LIIINQTTIGNGWNRLNLEVEEDEEEDLVVVELIAAGIVESLMKN